jgi:hypothetical protein
MVSGLKGKGVKDLVQYLMDQVFSSIPIVRLPVCLTFLNLEE